MKRAVFFLSFFASGTLARNIIFMMKHDEIWYVMKHDINLWSVLNKSEHSGVSSNRHMLEEWRILFFDCCFSLKTDQGEWFTFYQACSEHDSNTYNTIGEHCELLAADKCWTKCWAPLILHTCQALATHSLHDERSMQQITRTWYLTHFLAVYWKHFNTGHIVITMTDKTLTLIAIFKDITT